MNEATHTSKTGKNTTTATTSNEKSVWEAAKTGDIPTLQKYIDEKKVSIDEKNEYGETPLFLAVQYADIETVRWLVERNADLFCKNHIGLTPYFIATLKRDDKKIFYFLLERMSLKKEFFLKQCIVNINLCDELTETLIKALGSNNSDVRAQAVSMLVQLGKESIGIITTLTKLLGETNSFISLGAASVLVQLGKESSHIISILIRFLEDKEQSIRVQASLTLRNLKILTPDIVKMLIKVLENSNHDARIEAASILGNLNICTPDIVDALIKASLDYRYEVRRQVVTVLGNLKQATPQVIAALIKSFSDEDLDVRDLATSALFQLGKESLEVINMLIQTFKDKDLNVSVRAASILVQLGKESPEVINILIGALSQKSHEIKIKAIQALGNLKQSTPNVITVLKNVLNDESNNEYRSDKPDDVDKLSIRVNTASALVNLIDLNSASYKDILSLSICTHRWTRGGERPDYLRAQAVSILEKLGKKNRGAPYNNKYAQDYMGISIIIDQLIETWYDHYKSNPSVVEIEIVSALVQLGNEFPDVIRTLIKTLEKYPASYDSGKRRLIVSALGNLKQSTPDIITALIKSLNDENAKIRELAVLGLGKLGKKSSDIITALTKLLRDSDWNVKINAALTLVHLGEESHEVINTLIKGACLSKVAESLNQITPFLIDTLIQASSDSSSNVRLDAVLVLGQLGKISSNIITALIKALNDSDQRVKIGAASALIKLKQITPEIITVLVEVLKNKNFSDDNKLQAISTLKNMGDTMIFLLSSLQESMSYCFNFLSKESKDFDNVKGEMHRKLMELWKGLIQSGQDSLPLLESIRDEFLKYLNCLDTDGNSWLHHAVLFEQRGIVEFLIRCGIDVSIKNKDGKTAYDLATATNNLLIAQEIVNSQATTQKQPDLQSVQQQMQLMQQQIQQHNQQLQIMMQMMMQMQIQIGMNNQSPSTVNQGNINFQNQTNAGNNPQGFFNVLGRGIHNVNQGQNQSQSQQINTFTPPGY